MGAFLTAVLRWFLGSFTRLFGLLTAHAMATKIVFCALFMIVLPIVINNIIYDLMDLVFQTVTSYANENSPQLQTAVQFSGLAGYMINALGLDDAFAVVLSAMGIRFAFSWIPFIGPK